LVDEAGVPGLDGPPDGVLYGLEDGGVGGGAVDGKG